MFSGSGNPFHVFNFIPFHICSSGIYFFFTFHYVISEYLSWLLLYTLPLSDYTLWCLLVHRGLTMKKEAADPALN